MSFAACAVIPVYNHHQHLENIAVALTRYGLLGIFVDDGSDERTKAELHRVTTRYAQMVEISLPRNLGKGAAVIAGLKYASQQGYTHALQLDADGQHDLADVPRLLQLAKTHPDKLVSGAPVFDHSVPRIRFYGRYLTHILVWIETLSLRLRDSMCGFRVYPIEPTLALIQSVKLGTHMQFDTEIMVRLYWSRVESLFLPTCVCYPENGISHFRLFADNVRMTWMHVCLVFGMLLRLPELIRLTSRNLHTKHWAQLPERGTAFGIYILDLAYRRFGRRACYALLVPVVIYFFITNPRARRASHQFLATMQLYSNSDHPHGVCPSWRNSLRHFWQFAIADLDMLIAWHSPKDITVHFPQYDQLVSALAHGQGALLIGAHLGNLEVIRALSIQIPDLKVNAIVYTQHASKSNMFMERVNHAYNLRLIHVHEIDPGTAVMLRSKVAAGEIVVIVGDRTPVSETSPTVLVDFLGKPAPFATGPYILAHLLECPVYFFLCTARPGGGYTIHLEPFAERINLPRRRRETILQELAARYAARLADYAIRFPLQWYNFYDFWAQRQTLINHDRRRLVRKSDTHEKQHAHSVI